MENKYMSLKPENVTVFQIVSNIPAFYGTKSPVALQPDSIPRSGPKGLFHILARNIEI
jgi:hypothetical protein